MIGILSCRKHTLRAWNPQSNETKMDLEHPEKSTPEYLQAELVPACVTAIEGELANVAELVLFISGDLSALDTDPSRFRN
jgi:hypothetical protein